MKCLRCQHENAPSQKFCGECGALHLAEKILISSSALEGERKQVTVLFADLKGSMELLADRDPEEARKILDPVLELMMEAVHRYEGTVNQVMGDGIMALSLGMFLFEPIVSVHLGEICLLDGRLDEAHALAQDALAVTRERGQRGYEAVALRLLGETAAYSDRPGITRAEEHYRQAMALAEELGVRPLLAHCHAGLAKLYRRTGKPQQSDEHLATATAMYREMEMRFWLERTETEIRMLA